MACLGKKRLNHNSSDRTTYYHSVKLFWIVRIPVTPLKKSGKEREMKQEQVKGNEEREREG